MKIEMGKTYKDKITGFTGAAIGHCDYLTGCSQTLLQPSCGEDVSEKKEGQWFDDSRLICLDDVKAINLEAELKEDPPGCDIAAPKI